MCGLVTEVCEHHTEEGQLLNAEHAAHVLLPNP